MEILSKEIPAFIRRKNREFIKKSSMDIDGTSTKLVWSHKGKELEVTCPCHGSNFIMTHKTALFY
jgi:Rieske Fe-S protein